MEMIYIFTKNGSIEAFQILEFYLHSEENVKIEYL